MVGGNKTNNRGFSGLSGLVSKVGPDTHPQNPTSKKEQNGSPPQVVQPPATSDSQVEVELTEEMMQVELELTEDMRAEPLAMSSSSQSKQQQSKPSTISGNGSTGDDTTGLGWKWLIYGGLIFLVLWLISSDKESDDSYPPPPPFSQQSSNAPTSASNASTTSTASPSVPSSRTIPATPEPDQPPEAFLIMPAIGTENILSIPEIRWCIVNNIAIETLRGIVNTDSGINELNNMVRNYNSRCESFRYHEGTLEQALRDIEPLRNQIALNFSEEAQQAGYYQPSLPSITPVSDPPITQPDNASPQQIREAQQLLTNLRYAPGPIDGLYGPRTADAVKSFQRDEGITENGIINELLLDTLRKSDAPSNQASTQAGSTNTVTANYFTRGSHEDEVLRIQGTPNAINTYSVLGYEEWRYGSSTVRISTRNRTVIEWSAWSGNLMVQLVPGSNVTDNPYFTRGSHQDDVLRVQGTPDAINTHSSLGYEEWRYGSSTVRISTQNRMVIAWSAWGSNLNVQLVPGSNVTDNPYFTRGSHQDDVLRVQGTPEAINTYSALGYEEWRYGSSTVRISTQNRTVIEWSDFGRNLKLR